MMTVLVIIYPNIILPLIKKSPQKNLLKKCIKKRMGKNPRYSIRKNDFKKSKVELWFFKVSAKARQKKYILEITSLKTKLANEQKINLREVANKFLKKIMFIVISIKFIILTLLKIKLILLMIINIQLLLMIILRY